MQARRLANTAGRSLATAVLALGCAACGTKTPAPASTVTASRAASHATGGGAANRRTAGGERAASSSPTTTTGGSSSTLGTTTASTTRALPGAGRPPITLGDKNYTEQFVLGQLYAQALQAEGYRVTVNQNIGPTSVTVQALKNGTLMAYPEYLSTFDAQVAGYRHGFRSVSAAFGAAEHWAGRHGLVLLSPTRFSDTDAIAVTDAYAAANRLHSISDLRRVATQLTVGGPPQFEVDPPGLQQITTAYRVTPAAFKALAIGDQYAALNAGTVQAADVKTTDGELATGDYVVLRDPERVFGFGNVIPVISAKALAAEGPAFADTIARVDQYLTTPVMRSLNELVDIAQETPAAVARQFLQTHDLLTPQPY